MSCIYEHRTSMTLASGTISSTTLKVIGGLLQQVYVSAGSDGTLFRFDLIDDNSITRLRYDYHRGEINHINVGFPMVGEYTCTIANASSDDTFQIILGVQE